MLIHRLIDRLYIVVVQGVSCGITNKLQIGEEEIKITIKKI